MAVIAVILGAYMVFRNWGTIVEWVGGKWDWLKKAVVARLAAEPVSVPESASLPDVLDALQREAAGAAIVVDEHGDFSGMISRDEMLRAIGGRAGCALCQVDTAGLEHGPGDSLGVDGLLPLVDLRENLGSPEPLPEESRFGTVGGFVMSRLRRSPEVGAAFEAYGFRFQILELDGRRVARALATSTARPEGEPGTRD